MIWLLSARASCSTTTCFPNSVLGSANIRSLTQRSKISPRLGAFEDGLHDRVKLLLDSHIWQMLAERRNKCTLALSSETEARGGTPCQHCHLVAIMGPAPQYLELKGKHRPGNQAPTLTADALIPQVPTPLLDHLPSPGIWTSKAEGKDRNLESNIARVHHLSREPE